MRISVEQVQQVATLARLGLSEQEVQALRGQLEAILGYVEQLSELELSDTPATAQVLPLDCPTRPDHSQPWQPALALLEPAPRREQDFFAVPRIIPE